MSNVVRSGWRMVTAFLLTYLVAVVAGWQVMGPVEAPREMTSIPDSWVLAELTNQDAKPAVQWLAASAMWGNVQVVKVVEEDKDPRWRIAGLLQAGKERFVMIAVDKQPNRQLSVGDALPGGAKIVDIKEDSLCVLINGKKRTLPLSNQGATPL